MVRLALPGSSSARSYDLFRMLHGHLGHDFRNCAVAFDGKVELRLAWLTCADLELQDHPACAKKCGHRQVKATTS